MDLNLVRVFVAIHESRNLTVASERLFVTQSAVSQSLARLRLELDDPLFERDGRVMRPTAVADGVYPGFREAMLAVEAAIDGVHRFDPATSDHVFRIALSELGEIGWLPALIARMRAQAPGVRVDVVPLAQDELAESLARGSIDLAISPAALPETFERTHVKHEQYEVVRASGVAGDLLDVEGYAAASHVAVAGDTGTPLLEAARRRAGLAIAPVVTVQRFATLPQLLTASPDLVATVPQTLARGWADAGELEAVALPFPMDPIEIGLFRRRSSQQLGAVEWFNAAVARAVGLSAGEFSAIIHDAGD